MTARLLSLCLCAPVLVAAAMPRYAARAFHVSTLSVASKCTTKTVTKKVHGKKKRVKRRVCTAAAPTAIATSAASPSPTPTPPPTAIPTATSTPTGGSSIPPNISVETTVDGPTLLDTKTGVSVTYFGFQTGTMDCEGLQPVNGLWLYVHVRERAGSAQTYFSSHQNFATYFDGELHQAVEGCPEGVFDNFDETTLDPNEEIDGWIAFDVPASSGRYTLYWNEADTLPWWTPVTTIDVPLSFARLRVNAQSRTGYLPRLARGSPRIIWSPDPSRTS